MGRRGTKRILVLLNQSLKAARDEISGILHTTAAHPEMDVRIFDRNMSPDALRERLCAWIPDGIITDNRGAVPAILPGSAPNYITFKFKHTYNIPVVYLDFPCPNASSVGIDDSAVGRIAADFFLRRRYESFGFVGTNLKHTARHSQERARSFTTAIGRTMFGCSCFELDELSNTKWSDELERLGKWIISLPKPCAILVHADSYARLVTDACKFAKVRIPEQVALLGVDNEIDIADNLRPRLSSILPDFETAGALSIETLERLMAAKRRRLKPLRVTYGVRILVERESTQDIRGAGRLVDAARGIIRKRAHEGIRVADIARDLHVSPRLLELHFNRVLGRSVREELIGFRLEDVKKRLSTTTEPIESIAFQCGWRSSTALKLIFRKRFGMTMRDYRKSRCTPPKMDGHMKARKDPHE